MFEVRKPMRVRNDNEYGDDGNSDADFDDDEHENDNLEACKKRFNEWCDVSLSAWDVIAMSGADMFFLENDLDGVKDVLFLYGSGNVKRYDFWMQQCEQSIAGWVYRGGRNCRRFVGIFLLGIALVAQES